MDYRIRLTRDSHRHLHFVYFSLGITGMRALAIIGLKLMGISLLLRAAGIIPSISNLANVLSIPHPGVSPGWFVLPIAGWFIITLTFGLLLLFQTERIASRLRFPAEPLQASVSASKLLQAGLIIVGVYVMIYALSEFVMHVSTMIQYCYKTGNPSAYSWGNTVQELLQLLLALVVIGGSRRIAARVFPD